MLNKLRSYIPGKWGEVKPVVPVVRLNGVIGAGSPLKPGLSLSSVEDALETAFSFKEAPAIALSVNSPGGSPVQSNLIFKRIRQLADENNKQVLVFVEDVAASGGYMIALAGDDIIVDQASVVGSIGVVSAGFGFTELLQKAGVERRVYTSGDKKVTLDPFSPEIKEDVEHLKTLQHEIHEMFIDMVKRRRGDVLGDEKELFSGLFWTGAKARDLGLVDSIGDLHSTIRERFGKETKIKVIGAKKRFLGRFIPGASLQGNLTEAAGSLPAATLATLEEKSLWAKFGL
ncbi:putative signal peptide peptidase SppA [Pseudovibrio axinellae]|uniref:Putative signal peptide peptidase SppA n=1 Tax=Pseudovibrio axinellae TaxID=989403 RepID=A0A165YG73_9HYPH|nr:S49 family peptidase [Pseudovibrio axinellae]KZL18817.1 putative signal peptide peptidase SppA [Pseudovibrio axinellae]SEP91750.1 signal peptide peptidase SppA [Pseudovibrio axinellae]